MALTRFKDARTGFDGPVSGALVVIPMCFGTGIASTIYNQTFSLPTGMALEIVAIDARATNEGGTPSVTVGTTKGGAEIVAAVNLTATLGSLTLVSTSVTSLLDVQIDNAVGDTFDSATVTVYAYVSAPPDAVAVRGSTHF